MARNIRWQDIVYGTIQKCINYRIVSGPHCGDVVGKMAVITHDIFWFAGDLREDTPHIWY